MTTLIWITRGPRAGEFIEASDEEAEEAETQGWGQNVAGRDGIDMVQAKRGVHKAAQEFLDRRMGGYATREFRAAAPPEPKGDEKRRAKVK